jgi:hypothetical protein
VIGVFQTLSAGKAGHRVPGTTGPLAVRDAAPHESIVTEPANASEITTTIADSLVITTPY